ncbi:adenosylcobyric acid synthase (glutamine-hydrolysing) [Bhargavaea ginsengi]|uniref:Cobyric acid synthase n=1 Tax=Bhargavaea ginsengi TaxID=426757 RepID=A0A1H7AW34_9BACL|nr:cobyric acid synthase [Bhargavaea ginsengi]SEJ65265.1 adenosylcobyric acid synthase (glutamine-hydrolysing) [Bhargavaea ginsengi]
MNGIMIQGTASHVGKSMVCTAICRLLADEGVRTAPFKSQNMSSFTTEIGNGLQISRAQSVQAEAAGIPPVPEMNPIVLKPTDDRTADILLLGRPYGEMDGMEYRERFFRIGMEAIRKSLRVLGDRYDAVVIEGAGSPAEVNLNDRELVNMRVAREANVPVLLVADIERGGVFASIIGTLELLDRQDRDRIRGILINKFRGDIGLFQSGIDFLEGRTGLPVLGVLPFIDGHGIQEEDSLGRAEGSERPLYDEWAAHFRNYADWQRIRQLIFGEDGR